MLHRHICEALGVDTNCPKLYCETTGGGFHRVEDGNSAKLLVFLYSLDDAFAVSICSSVVKIGSSLVVFCTPNA